MQYSRAKTGETKCNLFAVLLDYVLLELLQASRTSGKQTPSLEEIQGVVSSLTLAEAPESFALAFKQGLQGVGESIAESIYSGRTLHSVCCSTCVISVLLLVLLILN